MVRPNTEQKLDMALDELVKSDEPHRRSRPQTAKLSRSDGPYARGANRGESRRRVPPEEKGLLKTQCFFEEKDLVIKLYDTEVLVIKEKTTKDDDDGSETQSLVLELTSGGFRTAETKAILNEALKPMALQVESENGATWQLRSEYKTPGQVTTDSSLQPFEDGMAVTVPAVVSLQMVKEKLDSKRSAAQSSADERRRAERRAERSFGPAAGPWLHGAPGHPRWPPPPGHWPLHPPHGWPHPPHYRPLYAPPHWPPPPGGKGAPHGPCPGRAPPPTGFRPDSTGRPLPDDMFQ